MQPFIAQLREQLQRSASAERKPGMEAYLKDQFTCLGVDTTTRRNIFKHHVRTVKMPSYDELALVIREMYALERELQYCAIELGSLYKKAWTPDLITTIESCILKDSWWDSVDHIASEWLGPYFKKFPGEIKKVTGRWNRSRNIWLQRSSIMFQKQYRQQTDKDLLSKYILHCAGSKAFFIQKAIGWSLRELSKTDADWVRQFVEANELKPLSKREALKNI